MTTSTENDIFAVAREIAYFPENRTPDEWLTLARTGSPPEAAPPRTGQL